MRRYGKQIASGLLLVLVVAAISLLVFMGKYIGALQMKLDEVATQLLYLQDTANVIRSDLGSMETNIEAAMEEGTSLIEDYLIQVQNWDFSKRIYTVDIKILPKEYTDSTQTSVYFGTKGYPLELQGYLYKGTVTLPMDNNYDGNVTVLFTNGDKKATEVLHNYIGFQTTVQKAIFADIVNINDSYKNGTWTFDGTINYDLEGQGLFEFESLHIIAQTDDVVLYDYDLIGESGGAVVQEMVSEQDAVEEQETTTEQAGVFRQEVAAEQEVNAPQENLDPEVLDTIDSEKTEINVEEDGQYLSGMNGSHKMALLCDVEEEQNITIYLSAVTKNGDILQLILFSGMLSEDDFVRDDAMNSYSKALKMCDSEGEEWRVY